MERTSSTAQRTTTNEIPVVALLSSLADSTRCRMLAVLDRHELAVGELGSALQLPQSTVSRHLKILVEHAWLGVRRDGTSHFYRLDLDGASSEAQSLWEATQISAVALAAENSDLARVEAVLAARRGTSRAFFASGAEGWDALRDELFGRVFEAPGLLGLLDPTLVVADLGCGTGRVAAVLAPYIEHVHAIDESSQMLEAARQRLLAVPNVTLHDGTLEAVPLADRSVDAVTLFLALHHLAEPSAALAEVRRILKPRGRLLLVDMLPHDREDLRHRLGHVWLGFDRERITQLTAAAGLELHTFLPLPVPVEATGPALFCAVAASNDPITAPHERVSFPRSTSR